MNVASASPCGGLTRRIWAQWLLIKRHCAVLGSDCSIRIRNDLLISYHIQAVKQADLECGSYRKISRSLMCPVRKSRPVGFTSTIYALCYDVGVWTFHNLRRPQKAKGRSGE